MTDDLPVPTQHEVDALKARVRGIEHDLSRRIDDVERNQSTDSRRITQLWEHFEFWMVTWLGAIVIALIAIGLAVWTLLHR